MWTVEPLVLSVEERDELERRVRGLTTAHRDRPRAEVVLLAADRLTRRDTPEFGEQAAAYVCGLYAKSCKHPTQGVQPGQPERREFEAKKAA